jgi:glycerol-3-phosphate cytidylyltransferase
MKYCFDLDGTICTLSDKNDYNQAAPLLEMVEAVNRLYDEGNEIIIFTARGASSGIDWTEVTKKQLNKWGLKYHNLIMNKKPSFDLMIDDKCINADEWRKNMKLKTGIIAGSFDVIHPGYIKMFSEAKKHCNHLTIALHEDPSKERKNKLTTILSTDERKEILLSIKYIDEVLTYKTENELENLLKINKFNVRILGDDYKDKEITGRNFCDKIIYIDRSHNWSTTKFKKMIYESCVGV